MSQDVVLAVGTKFHLGREIVEITSLTPTLRFPNAADLDAVAETLAASAKEDITMKSNLVLNAAVLNRQIVTTTAEEGGYDEGTALDITYGPSGEKIYTSRGLPPGIESVTIEDAADTIIVLTFDQDVNSLLADYKTGFSCTVAGIARVINTSARQTDNAVLHLTLASPVTVGQAVLLSFNQVLSDIKSDDGAAVQSFTGQVVTNNVV